MSKNEILAVFRFIFGVVLSLSGLLVLFYSPVIFDRYFTYYNVKESGGYYLAILVSLMVTVSALFFSGLYLLTCKQKH